MAGVAGAAGYARWIEPNRIAMTRLNIGLPDWPRDQAPLRIGHLSDLHCDGDSADERARRAAAMLLAERPDVVFLTGDYVTSHGEQWAARCADALAPIASCPLGAFAVRGNHDWWTDSSEIVEREFRRIGIPVLSNSSARLRGRGNVWAVGVESLATGMEDIATALANVPERSVRLLLVHEPDFADQVTYPISLQFSGHSHGGQVRLPGLPAYSPDGARKYVSGYYENGPHPLFVTRGVGMIGLKLRFRCPPEAALLVVSRTERNRDRG